VDRVPNLGSKGAYLKQKMQDKLIEHKRYIDKHGQDLPEILNWKLSVPANKNEPGKNLRRGQENGQPVIEVNRSNQ